MFSNILKLPTILSVLVFYVMLNGNIAYAQKCSAAITATGILNGANNAECEGATPDVLRISFYKLALCQTKPTYLNEEGCVYLLDVDAPVSLDLSVGSQMSLLSSDISIPEGTYDYALLLIDSTVGIRKTFEFNNPQFDSQGNNGNYCWTNGVDIRRGTWQLADMSATCGSNPSPQISNETFKAFDNGSGGITNRILNAQTTTTTFDAYLLKDRTNLATVNFDNRGYPAGDATLIWAVQDFNSPPTITANTTQVDIGFKLTEGINLGFNGVTCNPDCISYFNLMSFQFVMSTN